MAEKIAKGQWFICREDADGLFEDEYWHLVQVGYNKVCLVGSECANRFNEPVYVSRLYDITEKEWKEITATEQSKAVWTRVDVTITVTEEEK